MGVEKRSRGAQRAFVMIYLAGIDVLVIERYVWSLELVVRISVGSLCRRSWRLPRKVLELEECQEGPQSKCPGTIAT